jgi:hypothetical protein
MSEDTSTPGGAATDDSAAEPPPVKFEPVLIEHAVRMWDAERENSNRLSGRATLLMTALAALFGLGLYRIEWFRGKDDIPRVAPPAAAFVIKCLLAAGLLSLGAAFWWILASRIVREWIEGRSLKQWQRELFCLPRRTWKRVSAACARKPPPEDKTEPAKPKKPKVAHASELLKFPETVFEDGPPVGDDARQQVLILTYRAALYLQDRNSARKRKQDQGQQLFLVGLFFIGLAILLYLFACEPAKLF